MPFILLTELCGHAPQTVPIHTPFIQELRYPTHNCCQYNVGMFFDALVKMPTSHTGFADIVLVIVVGITIYGNSSLTN